MKDEVWKGTDTIVVSVTSIYSTSTEFREVSTRVDDLSACVKLWRYENYCAMLQL